MKVQCKVSKTKYVILDDLIETSTIKEFKTKFKISYKERSNYEPLIIFKGELLDKLDNTLKDYGITENCVIAVLLKNNKIIDYYYNLNDDRNITNVFYQLINGYSTSNNVDTNSAYNTIIDYYRNNNLNNQVNKCLFLIK